VGKPLRHPDPRETWNARTSSPAKMSKGESPATTTPLISPSSPPFAGGRADISNRHDEPLARQASQETIDNRPQQQDGSHQHQPDRRHQRPLRLVRRRRYPPRAGPPRPLHPNTSHDSLQNPRRNREPARVPIDLGDGAEGTRSLARPTPHQRREHRPDGRRPASIRERGRPAEPRRRDRRSNASHTRAQTM